MPPGPPTLAPLRHRPFLFLVLGRATTMFGNAIAPIALAFAVLDLTGSVSDLGLVVAARSLANVVFLLVGGVVADRLPRQLVMVASSVLAAASQAVVAALVLTGSATVTLLAALGVVNGFAAAFGFPASSALLPQTVPEESRQQANALNRLGINTSMIVGASAGGALIALVGPGWGLAIDAATFALSAVAFALVRVPRVRAAARSSSNTLVDLRDGWREFTARSWVWVIVIAFCFINAAVVGGKAVLGPAVADDTIGRTAWGLVLAAQTAGMVIGGVVAMRLRVKRLLLFGTVFVAADVPFLLFLGVAPTLPILLACALVAGFGFEQFGVAWETTLQDHIPADRLARVYSYDALGSFIAIPLGEVAAGPVAEAIGVGPALICAAGIVLAATIAAILNRSVRTLRHGTHHPTPVDLPTPA
ncbi:MFS transporter [Luedemannella helvata]|uniref:MFS transporter n=1 Tax=Luedemannella helvata TaxID=349315 RepID=A0ABP4W8C9_9ACTN